MVLVGGLILAGDALIGEVLHVREGVADVGRQLFGHPDAEAGEDVVGERRVGVVEAVGLNAAGTVEGGHPGIDARRADAAAEVGANAAAGVEILDEVQHQGGRAGGAGAARADGSQRLRREEGARHLHFDVAIADRALKAKSAAESIAEAGAENRVYLGRSADVDRSGHNDRSINILDAIDNRANFGRAIPSRLSMCSCAYRHQTGGRGGAQKCFFH